MGLAMISITLYFPVNAFHSLNSRWDFEKIGERGLLTFGKSRLLMWISRSRDCVKIKGKSSMRLRLYLRPNRTKKCNREKRAATISIDLKSVCNGETSSYVLPDSVKCRINIESLHENGELYIEFNRIFIHLFLIKYIIFIVVVVIRI